MKALTATVDLPMDQAEPLVREALGRQGFGVLTEIDLAATLKTKLDIDRPPYKILGACNPGFAHEAVQLDPSAGLLLPCNVVLEPSPSGGTVVSIVDPRELMPGEDFAEIAGAAADKLRAVVDELAG